MKELSLTRGTDRRMHGAHGGFQSGWMSSVLLRTRVCGGRKGCPDRLDTLRLAVRVDG